MSQDTLRRLLVKLGLQHPYHTLYHLLALKHGNYNKHGKAVAAGHAEGGMLHAVDIEKVEAAKATLAAIRSDRSRCSNLNAEQHCDSKLASQARPRYAAAHDHTGNL